jgi:hypothetical protein
MNMKKFSISFLADRVSASDLNLLDGISETMYGEIVLGNFRERFLSPLTFWDEAHYQNQWNDGLRRIIAGSDSCLITSITDPDRSNHLTWWPLYRQANEVHVQNHLLFLDGLPSRFDPNDPYAHIPKREAVSEEGEKISEWTISVDGVQEFLKSMKRDKDEDVS